MTPGKIPLPGREFRLGLDLPKVKLHSPLGCVLGPELSMVWNFQAVMPTGSELPSNDFWRSRGQLSCHGLSCH
jgi:hypothetical protein